MTRITLDVDNAHLSTLLLFLKTLNYIEVKKVERDAASEQDEREKLNKLNALAGAWSDERTAEQIIAEIEEEALKEIRNTKAKNYFLRHYLKYTYRLKSDGDIFRRSLIYSFLHWIIIAFSIFSLACMKNISKHPVKVTSCCCGEK